MPLIGRKKVDEAIIATVVAANENIKGVYFAGLANIIQETPADTGRARNNWFLTVGNPSSRTTTSKSGTSSVTQLSKMPDFVIGKKLYFSNNLPYISTLEYGGYPNPVENGSWINGKFQKLSEGGFSKQLDKSNSPRGWVRATLIRMGNKIRSL